MGGGKRGLDPKTLPRVSLLKRHSYRNSFSSENGVQRAQNSFLRRKTDFSKTPPPKIHHRGWKFPWAKKHSCRSVPGQLKKSPPNSKCKANANERQIKLRRNSSKEMFQNSSSSEVMFLQLRRYLNIKTTSDRSTFFV